MWCYGSKFLPTIVTVLLWQCVSLFILCSTYAEPGAECFYVYPNVTSEFTWGGWGLKPDMLVVVQNIALMMIVLHFGELYYFFFCCPYSRECGLLKFCVFVFFLVTISVSFVHREYSIWRKLPFNNWFWFLTSFIV